MPHPYPYCDREFAAKCGAMPKRRGFDNPKVASKAAKKMWAEGKARPGCTFKDREFCSRVSRKNHAEGKSRPPPPMTKAQAKHALIMSAIQSGRFPPKPNRPWKW